MQRYFYFIFAIVITSGTACRYFHGQSNSHVRSENNPQARDRIHKPEHDVQTNGHSKDNYHELKHPKNNYHELKHTKNNYHQLKHKAENYHELDHLKGNYHKLKNKKDDNHPYLKHPKHDNQLRHTKEKSHDQTKLSKDKNGTVNIKENETRHDKPEIKFPKTYHATGLLTLPYDGIMEPFEIWYAEDLNMSRIDYYYGE